MTSGGSISTTGYSWCSEAPGLHLKTSAQHRMSSVIRHTLLVGKRTERDRALSTKSVNSAADGVDSALGLKVIQ